MKKIKNVINNILKKLKKIWNNDYRDLLVPVISFIIFIISLFSIGFLKAIIIYTVILSNHLSHLLLSNSSNSIYITANTPVHIRITK